MTRCPLCGRRRATRHCPALDTRICPRCCGTRRGKEIRCPDTCGHLQAAREVVEQRAAEFADLRKVREVDPEFVREVENSILGVRETRFRDLKDREVREAVENLLRTLKTSERGLLYEYRSPDPRVQILADAVGKVIERYREGRDAPHKISSAEAMAVCTAALNATRLTTRRNTDSTEYLDHVARFGVTAQPTPSPPTGRIIIP